ncbi:MAG: hypothetical protein GXO85_03365 [Chlorobi bacterium]|nr:hypothetical protein [Chlorobiota bacterium]
MSKKVIIHSNNRTIKTFSTAKEAASWLGIKPRTFRMMMLNHGIRGKYICRYINPDHYKRWQTFIGPPKAVFAFLKDGTFVAKYPSISDAAKSLEVRSSTISLILKGNCISTKGYTFSLTETFPGIREKKDTGMAKKPIVAIKDGVEQSFPSVYAASKALDINRIGIIHVLKKRYKTSSGYKFKYISL